MTSLNATISEWREALQFADAWLVHEQEFLRELLTHLPVASITIGFNAGDNSNPSPLDKYWWWSLYFRSTKVNVRCVHNSDNFEHDKLDIRFNDRAATYTRAKLTPKDVADIIEREISPPDPNNRDWRD
jgi:hypothetical protein